MQEIRRHAHGATPALRRAGHGIHALLVLIALLQPALGFAELRSQEELAREYQALLAEEQNLARQFREMRESGFTTSRLLEQLKTASSEEEKQRIYDEWKGKTGSFQEAYDRFNDRKFDLIIERYLGLAEEITRDVEASDRYTPEAKKKLNEQLETLRADYKRYFENKGQLGMPGDRHRSIAMNNFLWHMGPFMEAAGKPNRGLGDNLSLAGRKLERNLKRLAALGVVVANVPRLAAAYYGSGNRLDRVRGLTRWLLWSQGKQISVQGRENLPTGTPPKTVDIYALMHGHNVNDVAAMAELGSRHTAIMSAVAPEFARQRMEQGGDFLVVRNTTRNPVRTIVGGLEEGRFSGLYILPEAAMPAFGYEVRPPQRNMDLLLKMLQKEGYQVRVIPVALPRHAQFLEKYDESSHRLDSRELPVVVSPPIDPERVAEILKMGGRTPIGELVRQHWLESLAADNFQGRILGMPPLAELVGAMDERFSSRTGCRGWFDRIAPLPTGSG